MAVTSGERRERGISRSIVALASGTLLVTACGGGSAGVDLDTGEAAPASASQSAATPFGLELTGPDVAAATIDDPPAGLVVLDVRTPDEFAEARIDGAVMIDFYRDDFRDALAQLDRDVPYVLYCRSGNRSGQTFEMMRDLGFTSVRDVDGGIVSWIDAGLPVVSG